MKTHVGSSNSILQISMEPQENTSANSIKSRPINQRKRLSPAQRRKQIVQEAVTLITQYGSYGFPMQALADAVGMTLPGLNHYVKNREELLSLVIETFYDSEEEGNAHTTLGAAISHCGQTDSATKERRHLPSTLHETVRFNAKRPELVALFMRLAIEASDPEHPAHEFYQNRHSSILTDMTSVDWELPEEYRDPERLHDLIVTAFFAMDGVQIQSLTNPNESMMQLWERAEHILFPSPTWDGYR